MQKCKTQFQLSTLPAKKPTLNSNGHNCSESYLGCADCGRNKEGRGAQTREEKLSSRRQSCGKSCQAAGCEQMLQLLVAINTIQTEFT